MLWGKGAHRFQLADYAAFYKQIRKVLANITASVLDPQSCLLLEPKSLFIQLYSHRILVHLLQKSSAQRVVDGISTTDDLLGNIRIYETHVKIPSILFILSKLL